MKKQLKEKFRQDINNALEIDLSDFIEQRYYLLQYECSIELVEIFFQELKKYAIDVQYFHAEFGEFYLAIKAIFDGNEQLKIRTAENIIYEYRKKGITQKKELSRKPSPQRYWKGDWKIIQ